MLTPRIFVGDDAADLAAGGEYALPDRAARHVAQSLRMRAGDALALFTGRGGEYAATISRIDRRDVVVEVGRHAAIERESPHAVTLAQSLLAADMMDLVVRKAVELGVARIVPILSARSQAIAFDRASRRALHWRQIAIAACEQCGRNRVPEIADMTPFGAWVDGIDGEACAVLDADAPISLAAHARQARPHVVAVGPEGGFTQEELQRASARAAMRVHLGQRVLRAETAAIAALATIGASAGDAM
jgi:16S rRNA (uracil1498-N3)-methyltransferase